jgi:hypothetical protein
VEFDVTTRHVRPEFVANNMSPTHRRLQKYTTLAESQKCKGENILWQDCVLDNLSEERLRAVREGHRGKPFLRRSVKSTDDPEVVVSLTAIVLWFGPPKSQSSSFKE